MNRRPGQQVNSVYTARTHFRYEHVTPQLERAPEEQFVRRESKILLVSGQVVSLVLVLSAVSLHGLAPAAAPQLLAQLPTETNI